MTDSGLELVKRIAQAVSDKKGFNLLGLDVRGVSSMTDFFLIAEGTIERHVKALAREVDNALVGTNHKILHVEGLDVGEWVVIDCFEVVIHLFTPDVREKYRLEQMWHEAKVIDLELVAEESPQA